MEVGNNCVRSQAFLSESAVKYVGALRRGENRSKQHFAIGLVNSVLRESSLINMTRGGDEDIETRSLKF